MLRQYCTSLPLSLSLPQPKQTRISVSVCDSESLLPFSRCNYFSILKRLGQGSGSGIGLLIITPKPRMLLNTARALHTTRCALQTPTGTAFRISNLQEPVQSSLSVCCLKPYTHQYAARLSLAKCSQAQ